MSLPECWVTRCAGTNEGYFDFQHFASLSSHTLIIAVSLYQQYTRAICELILILLTKNYVGIATLLQMLQTTLIVCITALLCYRTT
jgi:hypothetical protein